jgi:hypothetical protein
VSSESDLFGGTEDEVGRHREGAPAGQIEGVPAATAAPYVRRT